MAGFKEGALQLKKRNTTLPSDPGTIKVYIDTNNKLYTVDEFGTSAYVDTNTSGTSGTSGVGYTLITSGNNLIISTSGLNQIIDLKPTGVTSGTFGSNITVPVITLDSFGRILSASTVPISAAGFGTVTSISVSSTTLSGGGTVTTMGTINVGLSAITTSGTHTKIVHDIYGRVISATDITSADIPQLPPIKITTNTTNRFVTDTQITNWNNAYTSAHSHSNKATLDLINQSVNTSANISANSFVGVATKALSAAEADILNTARSISINGELTSTSPLFDGSQNIVISASISSGVNAIKIADGSISNTEFQYLNNVSANIQTQLSNLSANDSTKANSNIIISGTSGLIGGGDLTSNRNIGLPIVGAVGTYTKVSTDQYGRISAATNITSADIPTIPPSKILEDANDRFVSDTQINSWTGTTSIVQSNSANWNTAFTSAHNHANKATLDLINQSVNTSASVIFNSVSATNLSAVTLTIGNISNTEFQFLDTVSANIQTQLSNLSGIDSTKADKTTTITAGTMLSGGGDLSTNRTISHQTVGTSGTYSNIVTNSTGHITSARNIISADIPQLPATKIGIGIISDTEFNYLNNVSANIQDQFNSITSFSVGSLSAYFPLSGGTITGRTNHEDDIVLRPIVDRNPGDIGVSANAVRIYPDSGLSALSFNYEIDSSATSQNHRFYISGNNLVAEFGNVINFQKPVQAVSIDSLGYKFFTANGGRVIVTDNAGNIVESNITSATLNYLIGTSANIQNQLSALSANDLTKANSSVTITTTSGLTGGGNLTSNRTIGLVAIGTSGTYSNFVTNAYGQVTSARALISADIPVIPPSKILEDSNDRFVSDSQINSWTGTTTSVQTNSADWNASFTSAHNHANKSTLDLINQSLNTSAIPQFDRIIITRDGTGENVRIGNDAWIGDVNQANTLSIRGIPSSAVGYVRFGTDSNSFGYDGSKIVYAGSLSIGANISASELFDTTFSGNRVLLSGPDKSIDESSITNIELSYLSNVSANIQTQINQLSQASVSGNGAGTPNRLTKFVTSSSMGDSSITDTGSLVTFTTPVSSNNTITAPDFTGLASRATSALQADTLKTNRTFSLSGDVSSNVVSFNGSNSVVLSANIGTGIDAAKIANGSVSNTEFQFLDNVSANIQTQLTNTSALKADKTLTITAGTMLSGGGDLSTNRTISHQTVGTSGTYSNIITNSTGHITSARALISADIPTLPATKIGTGIINDTEFNYLLGTSANIQTQILALSGITHTHSNKSTLDLINQSLNTSATVSFSRIDLGKGVEIGSNGNTDWLQIASFPKTENGVSRKYYVTLMGGDFADNGKIDYVFDTYGSSSSSSAFDIGRIYSSWIHNDNEIYSKIEFKTLRNNSTDVYDIYVRGNTVDFFTLGADVKYTHGSNGAFQYYVKTSADVNLPTSATHTELVTIVREQPTRMLNDVLYIRNTNLPRTTNFSYTNTSAVGDFRFEGTSFYPENSYSLGTSTKRWNNVFGLSANIGSISATSITVGSIDNIEFSYLNNVSANIQSQLTNLSGVDSVLSSRFNSYLPLSGGTLSGDLTISKTTPTLVLRDTNSLTSSYPSIQFDTDANQGVSIQYNEFDSELPIPGYGLIVKESPNNTQFPGTGTISLSVLGEMYSGSSAISGVSRVLNQSNFQTLYPDLSSIEALAGTSGVLIKTATNTWVLDTTTNKFTSAISILSAPSQTFTITHNLGYLRPLLKIVDETNDQEILVSPNYISTTQLSFVINSRQARTAIVIVQI